MMGGQTILWLAAALALLGFGLFIWKKTSMTAYLSPVKRELKKEKQWLRRGEYNAAMVKGRQNLELFLKLVAEFNGIRLDNTAQAQAFAKSGQDLRYMNGRPGHGHRGQMVMTHQQFGKWLDTRGYLDRVGRWELNEIRLIGNKAVHENYSSKEDAWNQYNYLEDLLKIVSEKHPNRQKKRGPELEKKRQNRGPESERERLSRGPEFEKKRQNRGPESEKERLNRRSDRKPAPSKKPQGERKEKAVKAEISVAVPKAPKQTKSGQLKTSKAPKAEKPGQPKSSKPGQPKAQKAGKPGQSKASKAEKTGQPKTPKTMKPGQPPASKAEKTGQPKTQKITKPGQPSAPKAQKAAKPNPPAASPAAGEHMPQKLSASAKRRQRRKRAKAAAAAKEGQKSYS